jgi:hypothetical protein
MNTAPPVEKKLTFLQITCTFFFGLIVCVFSLNGVLKYIGGRWPGTKAGNTLLALGAIPDGVYKAWHGREYFVLELLGRWVFLSLAVFICLLLLNSIRHQTVNIFISGAGGLFLGVFVLTWLSLLIFLVVIILKIVFVILGLLQWLFATILSFIFWPPVLYTLIGLGILVGIVFLIAQLRDISFEECLAWLKGLLGRLSVNPLLIVGGTIAAIALIWFVGIPLWREYISPLLSLIGAWLREFVAPILAWVMSALIVIIGGLLALAASISVLFILGRQFIEQLGSAHSCGRDIHRAFAAGFTMGAAAGLALLVCSANDQYHAAINAAWAGTSPMFANADIVWVVYALMPKSAEILLQGLFMKASLPIFDAALLVVTLFLANCSLLMGLLSGFTVDPLRQLFTRERMPVLFHLMFGVCFAFMIIAINSAASEDT